MRSPFVPASSGRLAGSPTRSRITSGGAVRQMMSPAAVSRRRFSGSSSVPPPVATTASLSAQACSTAARSRARKPASPSRANTSATEHPAAASTRSSVSTNGRPTSLFPVAMKPVSTMSAIPSEAPHLLEIALEVASDLPERVAAELLEEGVCHDAGDDGLGDDRGGGDRHHVGALDGGLRLLLGREVDRAQRAHERRQRLECRAHDQRLAGGHSAFGAASVVRAPHKALLRLVEVDLVVDGRAAPARHLEAEADLDALRRLERQQRVGEPAVELAVPLRVRTQSRRQPDDDRLHHPAEGVAGGLALVDEGDDAPLGLAVGDAHRGLLGPRGDLLDAEPGVVGADSPDLAHPAEDADAHRLEQALGERPHRHARGRLARARALEDVAHVAVVVLERAREIGVPWPRARDGRLGIAVGGIGRHLLFPVAPVAVLDPERDRRPERLAPAHAAAEHDLVLLDLHPAAPAIPLHAAPEIPVDALDVDRYPGRKALDDGGEARAMGFPGGQVPQHHPSLSRRSAVGSSAVPVATIFGVRKTSSSSWCVVCRLFLKSQPSTGTLRRYGRPDSVSFAVCRKMPPRTTVSPSWISTFEFACRLTSAGMLSTVCVKSGWLDFAKIFISTKPSEDICGVTTSVMPVLIFSVATVAPPATPPAPVFTTVPVEGSFTRRIVRLSIVAATLFMVMTRGRLITLPLPSCSSAVKRAASACVPSIDPSARSSAEPEPGPKPDPKFAGTGKSARNGTGEVGTPGTAGVGAVPAPSAAPPTPTVPGKLLPVGLPVSGPAWKL